MKQGRIKQKEKLILLGLFFIIVFVTFLTSVRRNLPNIYNDEFGYWNSAAWFAGYDWSEVSSITQYYSYGYGIILSCLLRFFKSTTTAYHFAIFLNAIWIALSFLVLEAICSKLYKNIGMLKKISVSLLGTLFASNLTQRNYTWPECFLFLLFCLNVYLVILICEKVTSIRIMWLGIISIFTYTIHQRTLAVVVANIIVIFLLLIQKKITKKDMAVFLVVFLTAFIAHIIVKNEIILQVWNNSESSNVNNMGSQIGKLSFLMSLDGIKTFFLTLLGRIYYMAVSSFLLIFFAVESLIKKIVCSCRKKAIDEISVFLLLSLLFGLGISTASMFTSDFSDVSHIVYGRYLDNFMGPFILVGLCELKNGKHGLKRILFYMNNLLILGLAVSLMWVTYHPQWVSDINNSGIALWVTSQGIRVWQAIAVATFVWCIIYGIAHIRKGGESWKSFIIFLILMVIWKANGEIAQKKFDTQSVAIQQSSEECAKIIDEIRGNHRGKISIYAAKIVEPMGKWVNYSANGVQFLCEDAKIKYVDVYSKIDDKNYIALLPVGFEVPENMKLIYQSEKYILLTDRDSNIS